MMRSQVTVEINRPPAEVWAFVSDFFNSPRVRPGALMLRQTSPDPIGVGSIIQGRQMILGFETRLTMTVTEFDPPRHARVTLAARGLHGAIDMRLESSADGTKMDRITDLEFHPALKLISPLLGLVFRRQDRETSRNWKRLIEATSPAA
jgi:carbon monoxide dehydrogenase subunit G